MTEPNTQYNIQAALPIASQPTYLLLIDSRVADYQDIINAKQPGVHHIVFHVPARPTPSKKLFKDIEDKIAELGVSAFTSIGLVQHNDTKSVYEMFGRTSDRVKPIIRDVQRTDPDFQSWNSISIFITMLHLRYGIQYFDMMACALYSSPDWKYIIDELAKKTGVTVRASTDDTGAAALGGDWFLESHTGVNLKEYYFTEAIENYTGVLVTAPAPTPSTASGSTKKLILIDHRVKDSDVIINSMNDDTYCLVFNYFYDTPATILSKLRFLRGDNRYILDNFYYEPPALPTRIDPSGNQCTPCDDFDMDEFQLLPAVLQGEYLSYTMENTASGGLWPFYSTSSNITIMNPVFFQRAKIGETHDTVPYGSTVLSVVPLNYKNRAPVLVTDLDAIYELAQNAGEIVGDSAVFDCVGIIQHMVQPSIGYKFVEKYGGSAGGDEPAIIQDIQSRDANLVSWAPFASFIQSLKTVYHMTTLDLMACALYANPDWKYVIDTLAVQQNLTIRASLDNTGTSVDDGNWVLETNNVSLTTVYFTDKIYDWQYVLATYIDNRFYGLRWNDSMYATRGYDARLKVADATNNFTIETWYYETSQKGNCTIVDMGNYNYTFQIRSDGKIGLALYNLNYGWFHAESAIVPVAQWCHLAVTRSGSIFTFYINGVAKQTFNTSVSLYSNNSTFAIGLQSPDSCLCNRIKTDSVLYDLRLWNVARTATEIQMFRNRVVPTNTTGLVANYLCTDNTGNLNDRTSNALNTTIQNYSSAQWSNSTVPIPNVGFLINNNYSLTTNTSGGSLNALTHFDNITYTDFSGVNLTGVNFSNADLTGCNFTNANLTNANLTNAKLVDATLTGAITTGSSISSALTTPSQVLQFDGVDDAVNVGIPTWSYSTQFRTTMTVECWFKTTDTNNQKGLSSVVSKWSSGGYTTTSMFLLAMTPTGTLTTWLTNASGSFGSTTSSSTYKDAQWHHVAVTYNSSSGVVSMYIDGTLNNSSTIDSFGLLSNNTTTRLIFGSDDAGTSPSTQTDRQFRGYLSDVRIWNVVRSASEISVNYRQRLIGTETGLVGYWELNQGYSTGWGSYSTALDNTSNRSHGTLIGMGATPSGSWVASNIYFQPRISTLTLGANNGVYVMIDSSFSFIDPSSNSQGNFTYDISSGAVATISNGAATTKTIYATSGAISIPTLSLYEFPEIASLSSWQIDLSFTVTGGAGTWRALIGDMYNEISSTRGWGVWVSANTPPRIHWSWNSATIEPSTTIVNLNTPYVLTAAQSSGVITLTLRNVSGLYNSSLSISNLVALYNFDSNANDSSINGNTLTNVSSVTYNTTDYKRGTAAASFNGSNYFECANDGRFSPDNFTVAFWIKPANSAGSIQSLVTCRNGFNLTGWMIYITGNNLDFITGSGGATWNYGSEVLMSGIGTINTWVHVALSLSKSTSTAVVYINGSLQTTINRPYLNNTAYPLRIGAGGDWATAELMVKNGTLIDDFRFYNKILTASEINSLVSESSYSSSFSVGSNVTGKGPVTFGGWRLNAGENFPGTISYVNVSVPTNQRLVTIASYTGGTPATVTATQAGFLDFAAGTKTASLTVSKLASTLGSLTVPTNKRFGDVPFSLTAPTSSISSIISPISTITSPASAIVTPPDINALVYGNSWTKRGGDIDGEAAGDNSGYSVSISADGSVIAVGARFNDGSGNQLPNAFYIRTGGSNWRDYIPLLTANTSTNLQPWGPDEQFYTYIDEANQIAKQFAYFAGYWLNRTRASSGQSYSIPAFAGQGSVGIFTFTATSNYPVTSYTGNLTGYNTTTYSLTAQSDGNTAGQNVASTGDIGHVRVYRYNSAKAAAQLNQGLSGFGPVGWDRLGDDIDGEIAGDQSGISVSLSADGTVVAIGAFYNGATGSNAGQVRVYKYNSSKTVSNNLGPTGWDKLGDDIDGEASGDQSGGNNWDSNSVKISADGTTVAIAALANDGANGVDSGHVRVYKYTPSKTLAVTSQSDASFGPIGWNRLGADIDGEAASDWSGYAIGLSADGTIVAIGAYGNDAAGDSAGHVRVYKYTPTKTVAVTVQTDLSFGPIGWNRMGADIDGGAASERSGTGVALSADGTIVAIGANLNNSNTGQTRVYKYTPTKTVAVTSQSDASFGPIGWNRLGADINGESTGDFSSACVSLSADGTVVAIGATTNDGANGVNSGHVRIYKYTPSKTLAVTSQSDAAFGPIGWNRLGADIDGEAANDWSGQSVALSSDGTTVVIGARYNDGTSGNTGDNRGSARVYNISTTNALTYTNSNSSIADVCGNLLLIKGVNGTSTITATQTGNTINGKLDVSGTTYTLQYNPFTYSSSNTAIATVSSYGSVTIIGGGTTTITATQPETLSYASRSVTASLVVSSAITPTFGTFTVPGKNFRDTAFSLTAPTTDSSGAFTYSSNAPTVATVTSGGLVTVVGAGSATISVFQDACGNFTARTVTGVLVVSPIAPTFGTFTVPGKNFGNASFSLSAPTTDSSGAFTYTIDASDSEVATVTSGGVVTVVGAGSATITATQDASGNFTSRAVTGVLVVSPIAPTYQSISQITKTYSTDVSFSLTSIMAGVSSSSGTYSFSSTSSAIDICGGVATILAYTPSAITITASQAATVNYTAGNTTFSLLINRKTPSYGEFSIPAKTYGDESFSVVPYAPTTDSLTVPFTYTSSDSAVATINSNGTIMTIIGQGYTTITTSQEASGNYAANSITTSFLVNRAAPTFLKAFTIPNKTFGDASFSLLPFTEGLDNTDGTYHFTSSNAELVSISDTDNVTAIIHAYTPTPITIYVAIDACGNYAASSTSGTLNVGRARPTIGTLTAPPKNFRDAAFNMTAPTTESSGAFTYTIDASGAGVATVTSDGIVAILGVGSAIINATQAASGNYISGSVSATLVVSPIAPTFGTFTVPGKNYRDASFSLTAPTTDSSGAFTYTVDASDAGVATVTSGGVVTVFETGSATITATQDACGNFIARTVTTALVVSPIAPTFGTFTVPPKLFRDASFNLTAPTTDSSGAFTYSIDASDAGVATVTSGGRVTVVGTGSATITATQAAYGNFTARALTAVLVVSPIAPTFGTFTVPGKNFRDTFNIAAPTSDSSGAFTYTINTSGPDAGVATVTSDGRVTVLGVGSATITATQAAYGNFTSKTVTGVLAVSPIAPTFGTFTVPGKNFRDASFNLTAPTTDSSGAFTYSIDASGAGVATVTSGGFVTIVGAGSATITATQDACGNFIARSVTGLLVVSPIAPTFGTFTVPPKLFRDASFNLTAPTTDSSGAFTYTIDASGAGVATVTSGGRVTVVGAGSATITATQAAYGNFTAMTVTSVLVVSPIAPTFGTFTVPGKNFRDISFSLTAPTTDSSGAFTYSIDASYSRVATVTSGGRVTVVGAGNATISAIQDACGNFTSRTVTGVLVVSTIAPTLGTFTVPPKRFRDASFNLTAPTSDSSGVFVYGSSTPWVATVTSDGVVTIVGAGYTTITAYQDACGNFYPLNASTALVVSPIAPTLGPLSFPTKYFNDASFFLTRPTTDSGGSFAYSSDTPSVATVSDSGRVTVFMAGSATITASQNASDNFTYGTVTGVFEVLPIPPVISPSTITKNYGDASFNIRPTSTNSDVNGYNGDGLGGGLFSFSGSSNTSVITVFDTSYVGITGIGSANITVTQTATRNFTSRSQTVMVTISKGNPVLSTLSVSSNKTYGSAPFSILTTPTSVSNGSITYSSSDTNVATIDNSGVITLVAAGYVNFTALQGATAFYNSTSKTSNTMTVYRRALPLTRVSPSNAVINKTYGDSYFIVSATNESNGGAITYETDNLSVAGVINASTGVISVVSVGTATITARREQTAQYTSEPVSWTVEVARATTTLTGLTDLSYNVTAAPFTVTASSPSNGAVTYSLQNPSSGVLTIHPTTGLVTLRSPGTAVIVASQAQGTLYLAPASITATITVRSAGNALQGATITSTSSFTSVDLSGASLAGVSITNTTFSDAKLSNANLTNAVITSANFTSANLSGATLAGATITGATFTSASLKNADLSGATLTSTVFTGSDLSGANLTGVDASGASFANAKLNNVDMTGANVQNVNFNNTSIKGAIITDISFSPLQKLQLLKNSDNRDIGQIIIPAVSGTTILSAISETSPLRLIANLDLTSASVSVAVVVPTTSTSPTDVLPDVVINVTDNDKFYLPINENEYFQIEGVKYFTSGGLVRNYVTNAVVEVISCSGKPVWLIAGSAIGIVLETNTLNTASFVVPSNIVFTDTTSFMPTTIPTSNSESPIVYSSNNSYVATIDSSSGLITPTGKSGMVKFTARQVQNATYEPGSKSSNYMFVDKNVHFSLIGLNQAFNLSTLAILDSSSVNMDATDATAVFYVRLSDINNIFKYQTDANDVNDIIANDIKYYVFHRKWPTELKINPSHAMMNKSESFNMLGFGEGYTSGKSLLKHDFIRYIALRLFNTIHGVDLFRNETDIQENSVYLGETVRHNIDVILSGISTTSNSGSMSYDASGNKYLTNDSSGNTNLCRELMRQVAAGASSRFYNNDGDDAGLKNVPFLENDTITFKVIIQAAASQNDLTGVRDIPSRSYTVKLVLKNTVTAGTNANTEIVDSEMYPNSYPYSSSVTTYAPTSASSAVYNDYSPPAPIPFSRFGFNGWYYANSVAWVNVAPAVRNHIKWVVPANTITSTVGDLQYIRLNLKIHNNASLPYLMIYTGSLLSARKYVVTSGNGSLTNGGVYSLYINFNSYTREPAMIGYTNAALVYTIGSGAFANNEVITSIAVESNGNAAASNVEFTLASIVVGELSTTTGVTTEKEYGFEAAVPDSYP